MAHSRRAAAHIAREIRNAGGWIPFSEFMQLALYAPGHGYYAAGANKFGAKGDFHTAPGLTPLFGRALARQFADVLRSSGGSVLELGAGTGVLAAGLLAELAALDAVPDTYAILETSPDLRERQRGAVSQLAPALLARVRWLDSLPEHWTGVIFGNEVLDALPVELLARRDDRRLQRGVRVEQTHDFAWHDEELHGGPLFDAIDALFPAGDYESEINPQANALTATLAGILRRGLLLWIDYGFPAREYYHPQRTTGTLMCHYRQHAHADPLLLPGLQDVTAHVNFSAIAQAGIDAGLGLSGYASQAGFLLDCGIAELLQQTGTPGTPEFLRHSNAVQRLLSPAEMGELFKVIAFTREFEPPLRGFARSDRSDRL